MNEDELVASKIRMCNVLLLQHRIIHDDIIHDITFFTLNHCLVHNDFNPLKCLKLLLMRFPFDFKTIIKTLKEFPEFDAILIEEKLNKLMVLL